MPFRRRAKELEALAGQVADLTARLEASQRQREALEAQLAQLDRRTAELDSRAAELTTRTSDLSSRTSELAARTGELHERASALADRTDTLSTRTETLSTRADELSSGHQAVRARLDEVAVTVRNQLGELGGEVDAVTSEVRTLAARLPDGVVATAADVERLQAGQVALANELVRHEIALRQDLAAVAERTATRR